MNLIRLEKSEEEAESYRRRLKLLQTDLEKAKKALTEKQERLDHLEGMILPFYSFTAVYSSFADDIILSPWGPSWFITDYFSCLQ